MAETVTLEANPRKPHGSSAARQLRRKGMVPGVLYGHKEATVSITLSTSVVEHAVRHGVHIVDVQLEGKTEKALIREIQWDHLGKELIHIDLGRVGADERVVVTIPVEIRGTAPGIAGGGVLDQPMHSIAVECPVVHVPDSVRVNVGTLQVGQAIHVRDLVFPPDIKAMADAEAVVVQVIAKLVEAEAPAAPVADQAEPELIGRKPAEEGEPSEEGKSKK